MEVRKSLFEMVIKKSRTIWGEPTLHLAWIAGMTFESTRKFVIELDDQFEQNRQQLQWDKEKSSLWVPQIVEFCDNFCLAKPHFIFITHEPVLNISI